MENISNEELLEQIQKAKKNCIVKLNKVEVPESLSGGGEKMNISKSNPI